MRYILIFLESIWRKIDSIVPRTKNKKSLEKLFIGQTYASSFLIKPSILMIRRPQRIAQENKYLT